MGEVGSLGAAEAGGDIGEAAVGVITVKCFLEITLGKPLLGSVHFGAGTLLARLEIPAAQSEDGYNDHQNDAEADDEVLLVFLDKLLRAGDDAAHLGVFFFDFLFHYRCLLLLFFSKFARAKLHIFYELAI